MKNKLLKVWRFLLPFFFVFFLIHLLKDITQDILMIKTPLDIFGDAKEDLSFLSPAFQKIYLYGLGSLSFITEVFILYAIPTVLRKKENKISELEKWLIASIVFLAIFFIIATLLDPRF
jgi:hypothetical protein